MGMMFKMTETVMMMGVMVVKFMLVSVMVVILMKVMTHWPCGCWW